MYVSSSVALMLNSEPQGKQRIYGRRYTNIYNKWRMPVSSAQKIMDAIETKPQSGRKFLERSQQGLRWKLSSLWNTEVDCWCFGMCQLHRHEEIDGKMNAARYRKYWKIITYQPNHLWYESQFSVSLALMYVWGCWKQSCSFLMV